MDFGAFNLLLGEFTDWQYGEDPDTRPELEAPSDYEPWLRTLFPRYVSSFAPHHREFWEWLWKIQRGEPQDPFVAIWSRGGGKSTGAELGTAAVGARGMRGYALYVRETQDKADQSVQNIATLFESPAMETYYPKHAQRLLSKYGDSRGWRRNRLRTRGGFTVDALGLDVASRGLKVEEQRPDFIIFDDIDGKHDTPDTTKKKREIITTSILPAGSPDVVVLAIQNLITGHGIFAQLAGVAPEPADFLQRRIVSGPHPAVRNLTTTNETDPETGRIRVVITGGEPTWEGQDLETCQYQIDTWGWLAFQQEAQHEVGDKPGALWTRETIAANRLNQAPELERVVIGVDPPSTTGTCGIVAAGRYRMGKVAHGVTLEDASAPAGASPQEWASAAVAAYFRHEADAMVVEINHGGAMVEHTIRSVEGGQKVRIITVRASRGKQIRAEPVSALAAEGRDHHVGTWPELENQMCRWVPGDPSPDRLDAKVWAYTELLELHDQVGRKARAWFPGMPAAG